MAAITDPGSAMAAITYPAGSVIDGIGYRVTVLALFFPHVISFYASFEAYSYVFTAQSTGLWKTA